MEHIIVARIGTQYDPSEVVCITEEARDILEVALAVEIKDIQKSLDYWRADKENPEYVDEAEAKLKVAHSLHYQVINMQGCD